MIMYVDSKGRKGMRLLLLSLVLTVLGLSVTMIVTGFVKVAFGRNSASVTPHVFLQK